MSGKGVGKGVGPTLRSGKNKGQSRMDTEEEERGSSDGSKGNSGTSYETSSSQETHTWSHGTGTAEQTTSTASLTTPQGSGSLGASPDRLDNVESRENPVTHGGNVDLGARLNAGVSSLNAISGLGRDPLGNPCSENITNDPSRNANLGIPSLNTISGLSADPLGNNAISGLSTDPLGNNAISGLSADPLGNNAISGSRRDPLGNQHSENFTSDPYRNTVRLDTSSLNAISGLSTDPLGNPYSESITGDPYRSANLKVSLDTPSLNAISGLNRDPLGNSYSENITGDPSKSIVRIDISSLNAISGLNRDPLGNSYSENITGDPYRSEHLRASLGTRSLSANEVLARNLGNAHSENIAGDIRIRLLSASAGLGNSIGNLGHAHCGSRADLERQAPPQRRFNVVPPDKAEHNKLAKLQVESELRGIDEPRSRCDDLTSQMDITNAGAKPKQTMIWKRDIEPLEKTITNKSKNLQDIKSLLEDRGGIDEIDEDVFSNNRLNGLDNNDSFGETVSCSNNVWKRYRRGWCFRFKTIVFVVCVMLFMDRLPAEARSAEPRYETAYACEGKTLKIGCGEGSVIHLIRANYGRFSITICNDHGNTDWSVNCMSTRSLRVLHSRCSMHQNCSILASTSMFGDPCPNTLKYLEAHYQCVPASTTSTTNRPSPPWLITSQPTVWRSTVPPVPKNPVQTQQSDRKKPTVITPPTFRPHITLPPEVKLGDVASKKTTTRQPDSSSEREPQQSPKETLPEVQEEVPKAVEPENRPRNDKPSKDKEEDVVTEESPQWPVNEDSGSTPSVHVPPKENPADNEDDLFGKRYSTSATPNLGRRAYCPQVSARGLHWNWTLAGTYAVQPCPGGATGLARWKCMVPPHQHTEEERPRRRGAGLQSGENYHDLGLEPNDRLQLMKRLGSDSLLKGRDGDVPEHMIDYRGANLPDAQASSLNIGSLGTLVTGADQYTDAIPEWHGPTPDLSECRSVWLNSLEARVREGESLLSISNDLAQVTSSKTLYGGDMLTTTSIMKKLAQRMSQNVQTFPDAKQREAIVTDMLLGVIKTGSNLLEEGQRSSWADLSADAQNRVASALLTQLEENAFLLADAVTKEKTILQIVKNICLSVRVLEVKNVEDETFPSIIAQEQWKASEDTITIPKAALLDNRQNDLVRIVFFAFDRLEEILPPTFGIKSQPYSFLSDASASSTTSLNSERDKRNVTRVLNSKVISASLGNGRHIQLSQMVRLTMKHLKTENVTNPACVFWDYTLHGWSHEGCNVEWSNSTHTGCACSHLTNFAVLMDVHGVSIGAKHEMALRLLTFIGCAISAVALLAAIIVFQCFRNMKSDRVLIHKNLCACLLIAEVVFMCGIDQTQDRVLCGIIAGLLHYFFLAAFAWMFLEGFHLYAMLVEVFEPERPRARWYMAGAYLAPALVVLASAAAFPAGYGTPQHCWLSTDRLFVMSFVGPVALVLTANWICLSMVIYMMCHHSTVSIKAKENSKLYKIRVWLNSSLVLAFLLGLTWTFGLLYLNEQTVGVAYAFTILNSLQGLFIFIFHCLQNEIFQKECARLGRRHPWLSCCLRLPGAGAGPAAPPHNNATASSSNHVDTRQGSVKRRYHQSAAADTEEVDPRDVTSYNLQPDSSRWNIRPTAPIYVPTEEARSLRVPTPLNIPHSASHTQSIASMHSYRHMEPNDYQNLRSRSPSCFSNKMAASVGNEWQPNGSMWKNTSSKHHPTGTSTLPHHDTLSRQLAQQAQQAHLHSPYTECDAPPSPHHKDEGSPLHHQGYQTTRSYNHDFRNPHVYMSQHSPGSQEMIFRKHYKDENRRKHHHHHGSQNINHTYSEIASQQGRIYRRGSEQEFRVIQDDPVYEEIERNETLMSDMSDDNSGPDNCRQNPGHHGSSGSKFYGDHRPLISYSPGERHHHEQEHYGKYGKWDTIERAYDPRHAYESGRLMHPAYHQPQENNMRALAAVLNGENNVVCHLEPHNSYDVYQPQAGNPRTVSQPSF